MAELYAILIINGRRSISSVPSSLKDKVTEILKSKGYNVEDANDKS